MGQRMTNLIAKRWTLLMVMSVGSTVLFQVGCATSPDETESEITEEPGSENSAALSTILSPAETGVRPGTADAIGILTEQTCVVGSSGTCNTGSVPANAIGHFVDIFINNRLRRSPCFYRVRDTGNEAIIIVGRAAINSQINARLINVSSQYRLELFNCSISATGSIDNE
jgi:hypothetical protein